MVFKTIFIFTILYIVVAVNSQVHYHVWIGDDARNAQKSYARISIPRNNGKNTTTFSDIMDIAAKKFSNFKFEYQTYDLGNGPKRMITSINGQKQNSTTNTYWMLYKLEKLPSAKNPPTSSDLAPVGVDDLQVKNRDNYLFWLQKFVWE